jgi:lipoprotein-releasing system permease protein
MARSGGLIFTLAKRFLLSKSSDGFISFIAWVSVIGVALGVMALTLVTSVINGFESELTQMITSMNGDVLLYTRGEPVRDAEVASREIRKILPDLVAVSPSFVTEIMVSGPDAVSGAVLQGIEPDSIGLVTQIPKRVTSGRLPVTDGEIALGSALASKLGASLDSQVRLIIPFIAGETSQAKAILTRVVGIVQMGMFEYDSKFLFMALPSVQKFLNQPERVTTFHIRLNQGVDSRRASDRLSQAFGYPYRAKDWSQLNKNLFYAIQLEKAVIAIILTVIVVVAAFNVVSTLMMMIHDKGREVAILKAMGFLPRQSFLLFCILGLGIGAAGTGVGVLGGLGLGWVLEQTHWIDLPADIYYIGFLPVIVRWPEVALITVMALVICFLATLYPSWMISKRSPLEGLRYE